MREGTNKGNRLSPSKQIVAAINKEDDTKALINLFLFIAITIKMVVANCIKARTKDKGRFSNPSNIIGEIMSVLIIADEYRIIKAIHEMNTDLLIFS